MRSVISSPENSLSSNGEPPAKLKPFDSVNNQLFKFNPNQSATSNSLAASSSSNYYQTDRGTHHLKTLESNQANPLTLKYFQPTAEFKNLFIPNPHLKHQRLSVDPQPERQSSYFLSKSKNRSSFVEQSNTKENHAELSAQLLLQHSGFIELKASKLEDTSFTRSDGGSNLHKGEKLSRLMSSQ